MGASTENRKWDENLGDRRPKFVTSGHGGAGSCDEWHYFVTGDKVMLPGLEETARIEYID
ncbi:hypothetical protein [Geofilum rubicundum]|uniref:hypothetical protein n=1 Tax=Geofilum rubicundum TaxID=472113 RepID=UPI000782A38C|nr:hypothetical protein [Geofilum rubicundum]